LPHDKLLLKMLGKRVRLVCVHDLSPQAVWDLIGEYGTIMERDEVVTERNKIITVTDIWLVSFDNGERLWSRKKYLKVINA